MISATQGTVEGKEMLSYGPDSKSFRDWTWQEWVLEIVFVIAVSLVGFILFAILVENDCGHPAITCMKAWFK